MSIEKYSCYEFEIKKAIIMVEGVGCLRFVYQIYNPDYKPCENSIICESDCWYDAEQEARFAAIGHIDLLENGAG